MRASRLTNTLLKKININRSATNISDKNQLFTCRKCQTRCYVKSTAVDNSFIPSTIRPSKISFIGGQKHFKRKFSTTKSVDIGKDGEKRLIFREDDDGFVIRRMFGKDFETARRWESSYTTPSRDDILICKDLFPTDSKLCIFEYQGKEIGSAASFPWGKSLCYESLYYVTPEYRKRGFGERINAYLQKYETEKVYLDAMEGKATNDLLSRYNFQYKFKTKGYGGTAKDNYEVHYDGLLKTQQDIDFESLIAYDNKCFISKDFPPRRQYLWKLMNISDVYTRVAVDENDNVVGMGVLRPSVEKGYYYVGPLYADSILIAAGILRSLINNIKGEKFYMETWGPNEGSKKLSELFEMTLLSEMNRLHLNDGPCELKNAIYAITSTEVCGF